MLGVSIAIHRPLAARDPMNISWHDPELYYFLTLLAGIAALLASLYELAGPVEKGQAARRCGSAAGQTPAACRPAR